VSAENRGAGTAPVREGWNSWPDTLGRYLITIVSMPVLMIGTWIAYVYWIGQFWLTLAALIPGFLIYQHGVYLINSKPKVATRTQRR
jgi:hypothetical protein